MNSSPLLSSSSTQSCLVSAQNWPYPFWIAHRGAGKLAPENTLAAFRLGASYGYTMFECDVKLSLDEQAFLLHDDTLERTSNGMGIGGHLSLSQLMQLDAGSWHSRGYAGEPPATLEAISAFCQKNDFFINLEIKPSPDLDYKTGEMIGQMATKLWEKSYIPPFLSSFQVEALKGAKKTAPHLPRGLLLEHLNDDWLAMAKELECCAIICDHEFWTQEGISLAKANGFKTLSYTPNDAQAVNRLIEFGIEGIITDRVDMFSAAKKINV